ncbi:hypothetical protein B0H10DRAFT_2068282, partial [Mycena sp. CBHHK59/15]
MVSIHEQLPTQPHKSEARIVDLLLSPKFSTAAVPVSTDSRRLLQSLIYRSPVDNRRELTHIVRWITKTTTPVHVISCYLENLDSMTAEQVRSLSWTRCGTLFAIVHTIAEVCLELEDFESWELLSDLCATCIVKFITSRDRLGIAAFPFDLILTFLRLLYIDTCMILLIQDTWKCCPNFKCSSIWLTGRSMSLQTQKPVHLSLKAMTFKTSFGMSTWIRARFQVRTCRARSATIPELKVDYRL